MPSKNLFVVIPVHNASRWIEKALDSIFNQTYLNLTVVCVDDHSSDNSLAILNEFKLRHKNLVILQNTSSQNGVSYARNLGIAYAISFSGYVCFLDSDDYISDINCFKRAVDILEKENSDIVFYEFTRFWEKEGQIIKTLQFKENNLSKITLNIKDYKYFWYPTNGLTIDDTFVTDYVHGAVWRSIFKIEIIRQNNIFFDEKMHFAEDQIFMLHYLSKAKNASLIKRSFVMYRGWTKDHIYASNCESQLYLLKKQLDILERNNFYTLKQKRELCAFLKIQTYFAIANEEYRYNKKHANVLMKSYNKQHKIQRLLSLRGFIYKNRLEKNKKKTIFYLMSKFHLFWLISKLYKFK